MQKAYNFNFLIKYIVIGSANVGKSALVQQYVSEKFNKNHECTLGIQFHTKEFIKAIIFDTAGQQTYKSLTRTYYKTAIIALLVFDVTDLKTFEDLPRQIETIRLHAHQYIQIVLIGNKIDKQQQRLIQQIKAQEFAERQKIMYIQTSAKNRIGIIEMFEKPAKKLIQDIQNKKYPETIFQEFSGIKIGNLKCISSGKMVQIKIENKKEKEKCKC